MTYSFSRFLCILLVTCSRMLCATTGGRLGLPWTSCVLAPGNSLPNLLLKRSLLQVVSTRRVSRANEVSPD